MIRVKDQANHSLYNIDIAIFVVSQNAGTDLKSCITLLSSLFDGGRRLVRIETMSGAFSCISCHTLSHVNCSSAGLAES